MHRPLAQVLEQVAAKIAAGEERAVCGESRRLDYVHLLTVYRVEAVRLLARAVERRTDDVRTVREQFAVRPRLSQAPLLGLVLIGTSARRLRSLRDDKVEMAVVGDVLYDLYGPTSEINGLWLVKARTIR